MTLPLDGAPTGPTRAACPCCHRDIALTATGLLAPHGFTRIGRRDVGGCPSSGLTPAQARARLTSAGYLQPPGGSDG